MIKKLTGALSLTLMATTAMAGGVERSNQSVSAIFADGNNITFSFGVVQPTVTGSVGGGAVSSGDMAPDYSQFSMSAKMDLSENVSFTLINDQPYGANVDYSGSGAAYPLRNAGASTVTNATVDSNSITGILRYSLDSGVSVYGGLRYTSIDTQATVANGLFSYVLNSAEGNGTGYLAGVAYEIPEIALRVALTYNSSIDMTMTTLEAGVVNGSTNISTPQSLHLEAQSGIAEDTLLFGSVRWVDWSSFSFSPPNYPVNPLLSYSRDSYTYTLGVGRRINDEWSASATVSHESASGQPATDLAPTDGRTGLTLGVRYEQDGYTISGGVNYTWLGDTTTAAPIGASFADNHVLGAGISVGVNF